MPSIEINRARGLALARSALRHRDLDELLAILNSSPDAASWLSPLQSDIPSTPILNDAIRLQDDSLVLALLAFGAPLEGPAGHPSALFFSLKRGTPGAVKAILAFGGSGRALNERGEHPLEAIFTHIANRLSAWEADSTQWLAKLQHLLDAGAADDLMSEQTRNTKRHLLWERLAYPSSALQRRPKEAIELLVRAGAPVDHVFQEQTMLFRAIIDGDSPSVESLLRLGADPLLRITQRLSGPNETWQPTVWELALARQTSMSPPMLRALVAKGCSLAETRLLPYAISKALYYVMDSQAAETMAYIELLVELGADPAPLIYRPAPDAPFEFSNVISSLCGARSSLSSLGGSPRASAILSLLVAAHERSTLEKSFDSTGSPPSPQPRRRL